MSQLGEIHLKKEEILKVFFELKTKIESLSECEVHYAGSVLRYENINTDREFGDLDLVIKYKNSDIHTKEIMDLAHEYDIKRCGCRKITFLKDGVQIDLNACNEETFDAMMLTCTGDSQFNLMVRAKAKKMGFKLNEYGLFDSNGNKVARTQVEIFNTLHVRFYEPSERSFKANDKHWLERKRR